MNCAEKWEDDVWTEWLKLRERNKSAGKVEGGEFYWELVVEFLVLLWIVQKNGKVMFKWKDWSWKREKTYNKERKERKKKKKTTDYSKIEEESRRELVMEFVIFIVNCGKKDFVWSVKLKPKMNKTRQDCLNGIIEFDSEFASVKKKKMMK